MKQLFLVLLFCSIAIHSQSQNVYDKLWKEVEQLELQGKTRNASLVVDHILSLADQGEKGDQIIKAFLYQAKFLMLLEEDSQLKIIKNLEERIGNSKFPVSNVLESIYASCLSAYLQKNSRNIRKRIPVDSAHADLGFEVWAISDFMREMEVHFLNSLSRNEELSKIPIEEYQLVLTKSNISKKYRPSLLDFLGHRAINQITRDRWYTNHKDILYTYQKELYAVEGGFMNFKINPRDSSYLIRTKALDIFKSLQGNHTTSKDTTALASVILQRIKYCYNISTFKEKDSAFISALKEAYKLFSMHEVSALIGYELAEYLNQKSLKTEAHRICQDIIKRFPNSDGGTMAGVLKNKIERKSISHKMNAYNLPDQPILIGINYRNIDSLQLFAYRINRELLQGLSKQVADSTVLKIIRKLKPVKQVTFPLGGVNDFFVHSTEVGFPTLPIGSYLLVTSNRLNPKTIKDIYSYSEFNVSQLSVISLEEPKHVVYKVLDRKEGMPIKGAFIEMTDNGLPMFSGYTDSNGEIRYKLEDKYYRNRKIIVSFNGDTLKKQNFRMPYGYGFDEDEEEHIARTFLYLDRKIYRPGQTLYFKGVLVDYKNGKRTVKPNKYVSVFINDSKGNELKEFRLKTNKFGSVSGEYKIPKTILTGEFSIDLYEDYDTDEDRYYDNLDDIDEAEEYFLVEEYKRPKFKVEFQPYKKSNVFGDSIVVNGSAKGFSGVNVSNATVNYKVERALENRWWYHSNLWSNTLVKKGNVTTDANGEFELSFLAYPDSSVVDPSHVFKYTVSADVTDLNGETHSAFKDVRLGYENIEVSASMSNLWKEDISQNIIIKTTNLNGEYIDAKYKLAVYKLKEPSGYLRSKQWPVADRPIYSKDEFRRLFPYEPYDSLDFEANWPKLNMVTSYQRNIKGQDTLKISSFNGWQSGRYHLEIKAQNDNGEIDSLTRSITLIKQGEVIFDNTLFSFFVKDRAFGKSGFVDIEISTPISALNIGVQASHDGNVFYRNNQVVDNGNKVLRIPLTASIDRQIHVNLYAVKHNEIHKQSFNVELNSPDQGYEIFAEVFRNKLMPDQKENWIFKIVSQDGKGQRVEALASMYDSSLDEFATQNWTTSFNYNDYYPNTPDVETDFFQLATSKVFSHQIHYKYYNIFKNYSRLNWFGFDFSNGSYSNKAYLRSLSNRLDQPKTGKGNISGTILSATDGLPLPGVLVIIEGTNIGTQTDFDGFYSLDAPKGAVLVFSYVGMNSASLAVNNPGTYNVSMEESVDALDEVVIVAYGTQTKKSAVGSVIASLAGEAAGVEIINASGQPGGTSTVRIRGMSSVSGTSTPLYVVDGVPLEAGQLLDIVASDIASANILTDATATAIYGARGANGVVVITTKQGLQEMSQVETRTNLKETAFFFPHLKSNNKGEISFSFDGPQALTKWRMMLLAHDKKGKTGYTEQIAVTQKQLSVTPNPPRFLRETDTIIFSAKISNLTEIPMEGSVMLQLIDPLTNNFLKASDFNFSPIQSFTTEAKGNTQASWSLVIPENHTALQYKVVAKSGNFSDGEGSILPVLSNRTLLTESKPIWVTNNQVKQVGFKKLSEGLSETQKNHQLVIEYTSNPTWLALKSLPYLMEYPYQCAEQTFSRFYANALGRQIMDANPNIKAVFDSWKDNDGLDSAFETNEELKSILISESPWINDLKSDKNQKAHLANFFDENRLQQELQKALSQLKDMQASSGGFPWFSGGEENYFITRHIVAGMGHLKALGVPSQEELDEMEKSAIKFIDLKFEESYNKQIKRLKNGNDLSLSNEVIHYLYTRSFSMDSIALGPEVKKGVDHYVKIAQKEWLTESLYNKGLIALILHRFGQKDSAENIINALAQQTVRSEDKGWYWKENKSGWFWYNSPIETQAILIEAFDEISKDKTMVDQLKLWLLYRKQGSHWNNSKATTEAIYALLMRGEDWLNSGGNTVVNIGGNDISKAKLQAIKPEERTGYIKLTWSSDEVSSDFADITVKNDNSQPVMGGVYWQYFEDIDKVTSSEDSPLVISKQLFLKESNSSGDKLLPISEDTTIAIGDVVTVRMTIVVKDQMEFVHLKDLRASGFEPVDVLSEYKRQDGLGYYQSTGDVATNFFFDIMPKGTYVFQYELRANNAGNFSNGFAKIQSMYAPQFGANSKGERIKIEK